MRILIATLTLSVAFSISWPLAAREWVDVTKKFRVEAEFVEFSNGVVRLKKAEGRRNNFGASQPVEQ